MESNPQYQHSAEALLAQEAWLKRLARGLLSDLASAEDLAQDVLALALAKPPRASGPGLRAWLSTVARRMAKRRASREGARRGIEREALSGRHEERDVADRVEVSESVLAALGSLDEGLRAAVVMRYFDDADYREIGSRLDLSPAAARQRVSRGLAELRRRLDEDYGKRETWVPAIGLLAGAPMSREASAAFTAVSPVVLALSIKYTVLVAFVLLAGLGAIWVSLAEAGPDTLENVEVARITSPEASAAPFEALNEPAASALDSDNPRRALVTGAPASDSPTAVSPGLRFVDESGVAVVGVTAAWVSPKGMVQRLSVDGSARATLPKGGLVAASFDGLSTVLVRLSEVKAGADGQVSVVLLPRETLHGRVELTGEPRERAFTVRLSRTFEGLGFSSDWMESRAQLDALEEAGIALKRHAATLVLPGGSFSFTGIDALGAGALSLPVSFQSANGNSSPSRGFRLPCGEVVIPATAVPYLYGRVVWADTLEPVDGDMYVDLRESGTGTGPSLTQSIDPGGGFEVGLPFDRDSSDPEASVYSSVAIVPFPVDRPSHRVEFTFDVSRKERPLNVGVLKIEPARTLELRIVDQEGAPVEGAQVIFENATSAPTDVAGVVVITPGDRKCLAVTAEGYLPGVRLIPEVGNSGVQDVEPLEVRLEPSGSLRVLALNHLGPEGLNSRPRLRVTFHPADVPCGESSEKAVYDWVRTTAQGLNRPLRPRLYRSNDKRLPWTLTSLATDKPLIFTLLRPGATVKVELLDVLGNPLIEREVEILPAGESTSVLLDVADAVSSKLTVRVIDLGGAPVPDARFGAKLPRGGGFYSYASQGVMEFAPVAPGPFAVNIAATGFVERQISGVATHEDQVLTAVLVPARALSLKFVDAHGTAIRPDALSLSTESGPWHDGEMWDPVSKAQPYQYLPVGPLTIAFRIGTREYEHSFDTLDPMYIVPVEPTGSLEVVVSNAPVIEEGTWGSIVVDITESSDPSRYFQFREGYHSSGTGAVRVQTRLRQGTYLVEVRALNAQAEENEEVGTVLYSGRIETMLLMPIVLRL